MSTEIPSHTVPNFDHLVTQWMSVVVVLCGRATNSSQVQRALRPLAPSSEKFHAVSGVCGVGPAEREMAEQREKDFLDEVLGGARAQAE